MLDRNEEGSLSKYLNSNLQEYHHLYNNRIYIPSFAIDSRNE